MTRTLTTLAAAACLVMAANARPAAAAGTDFLFCRGPLAHSIDTNGILRIANKPSPTVAGQDGSGVLPGTCAFRAKRLSAPANLEFRNPALNLPQADLTRQVGLLGNVVTVLTAHIDEPTTVISTAVDFDDSGKVTGVNRLNGAAVGYQVQVSFSSVPPAPKFDPSNFNFGAMELLEKSR